MRHSFRAALLAAFVLLAWPALSSANYPKQCATGHCMWMFSKLHQHGPLFNYGPYYGYPPFEPYGPWNPYLQYNPYYYGAGSGNAYGWNQHLFGWMHGHGGRGCNSCGGGGFHGHWLQGGWFHGHGCFGCGHGCLSCGHDGLFGKHGGWCGHLGCGSKGGCGHHGLLGHKDGGGCASCGHHGLLGHKDGGGHHGGCSSCKAVAFNAETTDPVTRYAGVGNPADSGAFYAGVPTPTLIPASGP